MNIRENGPSLVVTAEVPAGASVPAGGAFGFVEVLTWEQPGDVAEATVPSLVTLGMADGSQLSVWPDGTIVMTPSGSSSAPSWSRVITPSGIEPNPYRS